MAKRAGKVGMVSLGCPKNQMDAELMLARLRDAGGKPLPDGVFRAKGLNLSDDLRADALVSQKIQHDTCPLQLHYILSRGQCQSISRDDAFFSSHQPTDSRNASTSALSSCVVYT